MIGEIGQQITDVALTGAKIRATEAVNKNHPTLMGKAREDTIQAEINDSGWQVGGDKRRIVEAGTALVQGLASGDVSKAVANASAPYIANYIGQHIEDDKANVAAHGIANVALALAKGENAGAQSLGAMTAEAVGMLSKERYKKDASQLTEEEKATVSAFASLAAGIAGSLAGGDTSSAANTGQAGKTTVENNYLSAKQITSWVDKYDNASTDEDKKKLIAMAENVDKEQLQKALDTKISKDYLEQQKNELTALLNSGNCNSDYRYIAQTSINQLTTIIDNYSDLERTNKILRAAIATITLGLPMMSKAVSLYVSSWLGSTSVANRVIGVTTTGTANLGMQGYNIYKNPENTDFSYANFGTSLLTGGITPGMGYWGTVTTNTTGAGVSSLIDGKSPWPSMGGAFVGSTVGYWGTIGITNTLNSQFNPWSNGLKEKYLVEMPSISAPPTVSVVPSIVGSGAGALGSEGANKIVTDKIKKSNGKEQK
ncbi:Possible hemagglutinin (DUF638) [Providencia stuartii]|nr:hypothetical protein BGK56_15855 [Providencia stuartii]SUC43736.1 Possible hemagglutinin (DUF638) [Providencia stuartii]